VIAAAVAVLAGAVVQSAVGFGFALVCAPIVFAVLGPQEAVWSLTALALMVNTFTLLLEGRRPAPLGRLAATVLAWSVPGMVAGALVLKSADHVVLQVALTVSIVATLLLRLRPNAGREPAPGWAPPATGLATGALATSLSTAGPPLVLLLLGRGHPPEAVRDTLTTVFLAQSVIGLGILAATGVPDRPGTGLLGLAGAALAGQLLGRPLFGRLAARGYETALTGVLVLSATIGLVAAIT
jgi:uncharacterized membrane protein YfcA